MYTKSACLLERMSSSGRTKKQRAMERKLGPSLARTLENKWHLKWCTQVENTRSQIVIDSSVERKRCQGINKILIILTYSLPISLYLPLSTFSTQYIPFHPFFPLLSFPVLHTVFSPTRLNNNNGLLVGLTNELTNQLVKLEGPTSLFWLTKMDVTYMN